jgi:hypothetical protein
MRRVPLTTRPPSTSGLATPHLHIHQGATRRPRPGPALELRRQVYGFAWRRSDARAPRKLAARRLGVSPQSLSRRVRDPGCGPEHGANNMRAVVTPQPVMTPPTLPSLAATDTALTRQPPAGVTERFVLLLRLPSGATVEGLDAPPPSPPSCGRCDAGPVARAARVCLPSPGDLRSGFDGLSLLERGHRDNDPSSDDPVQRRLLSVHQPQPAQRQGSDLGRDRPRRLRRAS